MIIAKTQFGFYLILLMIVIIIMQIYRAIQGTKFQIRKIPALEAIEEVVGRAVELGRPVHFSTGGGGLVGEYAPQTVAGLNVLTHTGSLCAALGARIIYTANVSQIVPLAHDLLRSEYVKAGFPQAYDEVDMVRYVGDDQRALMAAAMDNMTREEVAGNIMVGAFFWETIVLADHGAGVGAVQIGGTARTFQLPLMVACCDYTMLFEEMFAAGAYLSGDLPQIGSIAGEDFCKYVVVGLMIVAILLSFSTYTSEIFLRLVGG